MPTNKLRYIDALVVKYSEVSRAFYAFSRGFPRDIIIDSEYCPDGVELVGKWIEVGIDNRNRACELVSVIQDKFSTRIKKGNVEVKVVVEHDGETKDKIQIFNNTYFGLVCDINHLLYDIRRGVSYDIWIARFNPVELVCRWKVSPEQESIQPYFSKLTSDPLSTCSDSLFPIVGIVTSHAKIGNFWLVWCKSRPMSTVCLDYAFCPTNMEMLGKWAEMKVDNHNRVREPVKVIEPLFETRCLYRLTEFRISFQHTKRFKQDFEMFYHHYFGDISDSCMLLSEVEKGAWYTGWIVYSQHRGARSCWRLGIKQQVDGPFKYSPETERTNSSQKTYNEQQFSHGNSQRSRSTERRIERDYDTKRRMSSHRSSSPNVTNHDDQSSFEGNSVRSSGRMESRGSDIWQNKNSECVSNHNGSTNNRDSYTPQSHSKNLHRPNHYHSHQEVHHKNDSIVKRGSSDVSSKKGQKISSLEERTSFLNAESTDSETDINYSKNTNEPGMRHGDKRYDLNNTDTQDESSSKASIINNRTIPLVETVPKRLERDSPNVILTQPDHNDAPKSELASKAALEKEIRLMKMKLSRISELVLSLTSDESVSIPMKLWSVEEYEDLMELVKSNKESF